jgi:hypothetical protein
MPRMTWKEYKESLKQGLPPPHVLRMFPMAWCGVMLIGWVTLKSLDALGIPRGSASYAVAGGLIVGLLSMVLFVALFKLFPPKKPPTSPT